MIEIELMDVEQSGLKHNSAFVLLSDGQIEKILEVRYVPLGLDTDEKVMDWVLRNNNIESMFNAGKLLKEKDKAKRDFKRLRGKNADTLNSSETRTAVRYLLEMHRLLDKDGNIK